MGDEICNICREPKSKHVATKDGPFTHPRQARGEGVYILEDFGSTGYGMNCDLCRGPCGMDHHWERYKFVTHEEFKKLQVEAEKSKATRASSR
jgi:hypothetical protein